MSPDPASIHRNCSTTPACWRTTSRCRRATVARSAPANLGAIFDHFFVDSTLRDTGGVTGGGYFGLASVVELELLVKAGLSPSQAIVAAARTSAAILGIEDFGTIAPQKAASFVVVDANPLDDIANARRISAVYLDGREVDRAALQKRWRSSESPLR
jgi:hypothetical protein